MIEHEDALVGAVYKIETEGEKPLILKICPRRGDYKRESFFLSHFAEKLPVPKIIQQVTPEEDLAGAILMEYLEGTLLRVEDLDESLCYQIGLYLAKIHSEKVDAYGDLSNPLSLNRDPRICFSLKFEEAMEECKDHLPHELLDKCRQLFEKQIDAVLETDGPCIVHRDFRPGNLIISQGKIGGIIDWSSARGGFAEEDFAFPWPIHHNAFLEGYASVRTVPNYSPILPLLRLSRALGAVGFTVKQGIWQDRGAELYQRNRMTLETIKIGDST